MVNYVQLPELREFLPDIERFSSRLRLLRATARVLQFTEILLRRLPTQSALPVELIARAEKYWLLQSQRDAFIAETANILRQEPVDKKSKITSLTPIIGEDGLMRADSRINEALEVPNEVKAPIILSGDHPYVRLLIKEYHVKFHHGNHHTVLNEIRQQFWVTKLRATLKSVVTSCQDCRVRRAVPQRPRLGNLPAGR